MISMNTRPKLRDVGVHPITHNGQHGLILQDPLQLSEQTVFVPQELAVLLPLCDGTRDLPTLQAMLAARAKTPVPADLVSGFIAILDDTFLLDNARAADAIQHAVDAYHSAAARPAASAGLSYPSDADALRRWLDEYIEALDAPLHTRPGVRGVLSPHIDYMRGGPIYARTWTAAAAAARTAELLIIFGTDHAGGSRLTLTRQSYATPYGTMPTDQDAVDQLSAAIGTAAFADELHHRKEHSIELSLTWVHHMRGGAPCPTVPVLCGPFHDFIAGTGTPEKDATIESAVAALQALAAARRTLFVASGDLAHMGPAFDTAPLGWVERAQMQLDDRVLLGAICAGDADCFFAILNAGQSRRNVCGLAPIYLMLRALGGAKGTEVGYDRCPADEQKTSFVSIAGVVLE